MKMPTNERNLGHEEENIFPRTAFIYAYKTKDAEKWGIDPNEVSLAYQVQQPLAPYQCDDGKSSTAYMLREFKKAGGLLKVMKSDKDLVIPLSEHKILVLPVLPELLQEWGVSSLLD